MLKKFMEDYYRGERFTMTWVTKKWSKIPINERSCIADRLQCTHKICVFDAWNNYQCDIGVFTLREL